MTAKLRNPIFCAIDTTEVSVATSLAAKVGDCVGGLKLGLEFFTANGIKGVQQVQKASGLPIFLDQKFHDIPNTVAGAVRAACQLGIAMLTIHTSGGRAMMEAAAKAATDAAHEFPKPRPVIIGVTVLTSMDDDDLAATGVNSPVGDQVRRLAELAKTSGLDGIVCSPLEAEMLRADLGPGFKLVTPGVRPLWAAANDQKRFMSPADALKAGADYLVIGRPITAAADPAAAATRIAAEIAPLVTPAA
ncbi:MAG: orotidine-5'-phosphate decarboxylase [Proteobacteria bacterium]|nr:orotidine-5'-phosphate decarboxylase [Pseudomonadota bacterium]